MQILGLGTDIVQIKRIEAFSQKPGALERVFSAEEIAYSLARKNKYQHLAVRFAAKGRMRPGADIAGADHIQMR